ncbi:hypothetical protein B0675_39565 [Streptomyces sp. M41(2017)]|uniref:hypothetical protein n=1 Tax=Streptomyces sp. M41(2017) TaxID=1955065 RepID=UPI0009BF9459|nr:hypothetical protein [Streptomyces sp. M41(2017)]OQQ13130.1 hypothetical protein B0675_39565 [Streptomyces sp. M41(2017)]
MGLHAQVTGLWNFAEMAERVLEGMGLGSAQIKAADLQGLEATLDRVNDAIEHVDQLPRMTFKTWVVSAEEGVSLLPVLLQRKRLIVDRLNELRSEQKISGLRELIDRLPQGDERQALVDQLDELERQSVESEAAVRAVASEESALQFQRERDLALLKIQLSERRWSYRSKLLARDAIAPMIGAILLVGLAVTLVVAMFLGTTVSELISNSFLIVLGYFFGQTTERRSQPESAGGPSGQDVRI